MGRQAQMMPVLISTPLQTETRIVFPGHFGAFVRIFPEEWPARLGEGYQLTGNVFQVRGCGKACGSNNTGDADTAARCD